MAPDNETRLTVLSEAGDLALPAGSHVMTVLVEVPPGSAGTPPHRHSGPVFAYMTEGSLVFELEGDAPVVVDAGGSFWEPGGDRVHWQAANATEDTWARFVAVMVCAPDVPMLTYLSEREIEERTHLRHPDALAE